MTHQPLLTQHVARQQPPERIGRPAAFAGLPGGRLFGFGLLAGTLFGHLLVGFAALDAPHLPPDPALQLPFALLLPKLLLASRIEIGIPVHGSFNV